MAGEDCVWGPFLSSANRLSNWDSTAACETEREFLIGALKTVVDDFTPKVDSSLLSVIRCEAECEERVWLCVLVELPSSGSRFCRSLLDLRGLRLPALKECSCVRGTPPIFGRLSAVESNLLRLNRRCLFE